MDNTIYKYSFDVIRLSSSVDENNFEIESEVTNSSDNKCYLEPLTGQERYYNDRKELYTTHRIFTDMVDVTEKDVLQISGSSYDIDLIQNFDNNHLELILIARK